MEHADFLGLWTIQRRIDDRKAGSTARFQGEADLTDGAPYWYYRERGALRLATGQSFQADRSYLWQPAIGGFDILFDDERPFHHLRFDTPQAAHWCDPDQYDVRYDFSDWPRWRAVWQVSGPRKDYTMVSEMCR